MDKFDSIESAIEDIRKGKMVIVVDNEDRENEGDFICAAECITSDTINFMASYGRGLICAPVDELRADELNLPLMVRTNTALHETAFTVSVDLIGHGCSTGISTYDRALTIKALADQKFVAADFARPGHIFPLRAKSGGVLQRTGHTEATIDLAKLAGLKPAGALVEILNEDGTMARLPQLIEKAQLHNLKLISISDLVEYRLKRESLVMQTESLEKNIYGQKVRVLKYKQLNSSQQHVAIVKGNINPIDTCLVRVQHCLVFAELLDLLVNNESSLLSKSMREILKADQGVLLLLNSNDTNVDPFSKMEYKIEPPVIRTEQDQRDIGIGAQILKDIGIKKMIILSNHPRKTVALEGYGLQVEKYLRLD